MTTSTTLTWPEPVASDKPTIPASSSFPHHAVGLTAGQCRALAAALDRASDDLERAWIREHVEPLNPRATVNELAAMAECLGVQPGNLLAAAWQGDVA
jgi:hypothetical protein